MVANRIDTPETGRPEKAGSDQNPSNGNGNGAGKPKTSKGLLAWLPLIISIGVMPSLAYAMTTFLLLPKLQTELGTAAEVAVAQGKAGPASAASAAAAKEKRSKNKTVIPLGKILVNVAGSVGTRYLTSSISMVSTNKEFKDKIDRNRDQLLDVASATMGSKTIADLEKPGARNLIRAELISVFNNALGDGLVEDIYITELAIQ